MSGRGKGAGVEGMENEVGWVKIGVLRGVDTGLDAPASRSHVGRSG